MEEKSRKHKMQSPERKQKADKLLNYLIIFMMLLIASTATIIIKNTQADELARESKVHEKKVEEDKKLQEEKATEEKPTEEKQDVSKEDASVSTKGETDRKTEVTKSDDPIVEEVIVDKNWKPTKTAQVGPHVSMYQKGTLDWEEKIETLSRTSGLDVDNMIVLRVGNNGGAQNAIGVVTSLDGVEKYRISMEWVDNEGWLPVKMEKLYTTEGAY